VLVAQFAAGIYGGYFGAAVGIVMLGILGFLGIANIHRMNGLRTWGGACMNGVAAVAFAFSSLVSWPIALAMAVGSIGGGYLGAKGALRLPQQYVRWAIVALGVAGGASLLWKT
jgi:uncharacterized membrane protein YfcA